MGLFDLFKKKEAEPEETAVEEVSEGEVSQEEILAELEAQPEAAPAEEEEPAEAVMEETAEEVEEAAEEEALPEPEPAPAAEEPAKEKKGFFQKIREGLARTASNIGQVFTGYGDIDDDFYDELEESLILADLGMDTTMEIMDQLRAKVKEAHLKTTEEARVALRQVIAKMVDVGPSALDLRTQPSVILVIGVNGVGKTTTIGKIANQLRLDGKKVLLCAADTFRAAAADQLEIWAGRAQVELIRQDEGADPAAVVFDAIAAAKARGSDVILCDTAGRLHNKQNLMNELGKIARIIDRELPGAAKEVLLVLDGTTGQNGLVQARQFSEIAGCTGMIVTKLDGTAKGGVVVAVAHELQIPVKFIGVGEQMDDLMPFDPSAFAEALV